MQPRQVWIFVLLHLPVLVWPRAMQSLTGWAKAFGSLAASCCLRQEKPRAGVTVVANLGCMVGPEIE